MAINMLRPVPIDIEPLRTNLFVLEFPGQPGFSEWMVQSVSRPTMSIPEIPIPFLNTFTKLASRGSWQPIQVTFIEPVGPSSAQPIMEWIKTCVDFSTGLMQNATNYKKTLILRMLTPYGGTAQTWTLYGAFVNAFTPGQLSYNDSQLAETSIGIAYDYAVLEY